jgi:hypothetical protein
MDKENRILLAIDPGDEYSAFVFMDIDTYKPLYFAKEENNEAINHMLNYVNENNGLAVVDVRNVACEMIASYGMGVGAHVFWTCVEIGRFTTLLKQAGCKVDYIYRKDEKMNLCKSMKAKDSNIRIALIDRFAQFDKKTGKGTKKNPDWFYGFSADCWQAYAVGVTWIDIQKGKYEITD